MPAVVDFGWHLRVHRKGGQTLEMVQHRVHQGAERVAWELRGKAEAPRG